MASNWNTWSQATEGAILFFGLGKANAVLKLETETGVAIKTTGRIEMQAEVGNGIRQQYINAVAGLKGIGQNLLKNGVSEESVARALNLARRNVGEMFKEATPKDLRELIYRYNERRYGDKLGPTYEKLRSAGKTNSQIIESASRPMGNETQLGRAIYKELGEGARPILEKYKMIPQK